MSTCTRRSRLRYGRSAVANAEAQRLQRSLFVCYGAEYWDPKYLPFVQAFNRGWIRFPGGTTSMAVDWETAHENTTWMATLQPEIPTVLYSVLVTAQELTQAKGGACLFGDIDPQSFGCSCNTSETRSRIY